MKRDEKPSIALVAPFPPLLGGMAQLALSMYEGLGRNGHRVYRVDLGRGGTYSLLALYIRMFWVLRKADVVQVISASGRALWAKDLPAILIGRVLGKRVVLHFVGGGAPGKAAAWKSRHKLPFSLAHKVVVPTALFGKALNEQGIEAEFEVIPHVVDIERFSAIEAVQKQPILIGAKGLTEYAGFDLLIRAFKKIRQKFGSGEFWIAGEGPERNRLEELVSQTGTEGIFFLGGVPREKMPELLSRGTVFVHGTRVESFGIGLVEAMASGLPVVAFAVGGIPDVVSDGKSGFLVPYGSTDELARQVQKLLENEGLREEMSKNAVEESRRFRWEAVGRLWDRFYLDLTQGNN